MKKINGDIFAEEWPDQKSGIFFKIRKKLYDEQTDFQHIEVFETETFGNLMAIDDLVMLTTRDNFLYHEMMSHPVLFTHPCPKKVLIIGGGDCGTLHEVIKHSCIEKIQQVDIDEGVTRAALICFPELCQSNMDPRIELYFDDGIKWVENATPDSYDIIIVDSTDPVGPAEGLFNETFYHHCYQALNENGILLQQSESPLFHVKLIQDMHHSMAAARFSETQTIYFPQPAYPSGWWSCTLAGKSGNLHAFREQDAATKDFHTEYYNVDIHRAALAQPEFMRRALAHIQQTAKSL